MPHIAECTGADDEPGTTRWDNEDAQLDLHIVSGQRRRAFTGHGLVGAW